MRFYTGRRGVYHENLPASPEPRDRMQTYIQRACRSIPQGRRTLRPRRRCRVHLHLVLAR